MKLFATLLFGVGLLSTATGCYCYQPAGLGYANPCSPCGTGYPGVGGYGTPYGAIPGAFYTPADAAAMATSVTTIPTAALPPQTSVNYVGSAALNVAPPFAAGPPTRTALGPVESLPTY